MNTQHTDDVSEVSVGEAPAGLTVSPNNQWLYVTNRDSNDIAIIDTATLTIKNRIKVGEHPFGIFISNSGNA